MSTIKPGEVNFLTPFPKVEPIKHERLSNLDQALEIAKLLPETDAERLRLLQVVARVWMYHNTTVAIVTDETH